MSGRAEARALALMVQPTGVAEVAMYLAAIEVIASQASLPGMQATWPAERCAGLEWARKHEIEGINGGA